VGKAVAVSSPAADIDQLTEQSQAAKIGKYLQVGYPTGAAANSPSSMPWESYDAATLAQVAQCLTGCCSAIDAIQQREAVEAAAGTHPQDQEHVWDLQEAAGALDCAMGIVARLSFIEAAEGEVTKAGKVLSAKNVEALEKAHDHLRSVIDGAKNNKAGNAGSTSEEEKIQMEVTKSEFVAGVQEIIKAERKAEKKAKKEEAEAEAQKNANNGGDVTTADIHPTGSADADDVNAIPNGGSVDPKYVNKGEGDEPEPAVKQMADQLETLTKGLSDVQEMVAKFAKRPRAGGPSLDGQARGISPAAEGRLSDATKAAGDVDIEKLAKALEDESDPVKKSELGLKLTHARLVRAHESGQL